jgi:hypothetical protein
MVSVELPLSVQLLGVTTKYEMDTKSNVGNSKDAREVAAAGR